MGALDDFSVGVVIGRLRIFVEVEAGVAFGALDVLLVGGIGQAQLVEEGVALALVHPVIALRVFFDEHGVAVSRVVVGKLGGDAVEGLVRMVEDVVATTEQIEQRPVVEALVGVVKAVDTLEVFGGGPQY